MDLINLLFSAQCCLCASGTSILSLSDDCKVASVAGALRMSCRRYLSWNLCTSFLTFNSSYTSRSISSKSSDRSLNATKAKQPTNHPPIAVNANQTLNRWARGSILGPFSFAKSYRSIAPCETSGCMWVWPRPCIFPNCLWPLTFSFGISSFIFWA